MRIAHAFLVSTLFLISACSQNGGSPEFLKPQNEFQPSVGAPSVQKELAKESGRERIVYHVGPVDIQNAQTIGDSVADPISMRFQTDRAVWVTGFIPKVVDSNGTELPSELLHEAVMFNVHEENPLCPGSPNAVAITTSMLTEVNFPDGFGYAVLPTDPLEIKATLKSDGVKSYSGVFFEMTLITVAVNEFASITELTPVLLELDPCKHSPMEVAPKTFVERSATYQIPGDSRLIVASGAVQTHGASVSLTSEGVVSPFWRAEAVFDDKHNVTALTDNPLEDPSGVAFKAGQRITLGVSYDNRSDSWLSGATAAALIYLAPK